jgi:hypothetical protein
MFGVDTVHCTMPLRHISFYIQTVDKKIPRGLMVGVLTSSAVDRGFEPQ